MRGFARLFAVGLCGMSVLGAGRTLFAQTQSASIDGVVRDTTDAVMPGVTVEVSSPVLIEKVRSTVTDENGAYRIIELRPGTYTVVFTLPGFATVRREGLVLTPNFNATVNAQLKVGDLQETITVSGQSPVVDVRTVTRQTALSQELLDTIPSGSRTPISLANLVPAALTPPTARDVGGSKGESNVRMAIHGAIMGDQKLLYDGMRYNNVVGGGVGRSFFINTALMDEVVLTTGGGGSAETSTGGVHINFIPKSGGNNYSVYFSTTETTEGLQSDNLSDELRARNASTTTRVKYLYDVGGGVGGPIKKDHAWFYTSHRKWGDKTTVANLFHNATPHTMFFTPDVSRPVDQWNWYQDHAARLTWQVSPKNKVTYTLDWQRACQCQSAGVLTGTSAFEANGGLFAEPSYVTQVTWLYPASSRLLFEGGAILAKQAWQQKVPEGVLPTDIAIREQSTNFSYNRPISIGRWDISQTNQRLSMSYVTGAHHFKAGVNSMFGWFVVRNYSNPQQLSYTFNNQRPTQLTQYSLINTDWRVWPELGFFAQHQWTIRRLTLNYGLRLDTINSKVPRSQQPASRFLGARSFDEVTCVPCWKDLSPRLAASYDLFGNGKTALKASASRYVGAQTIQIATLADPVSASVNQVNRAWNDLNGDFVPDCDLHNPLAHAECGQISNLAFGQTRLTTRFDPELINGWQKRNYNWQASASIDHELWPGVAVNAGYFRTWYGNFTVTDNRAVTPADHDPYCITHPASSGLPGAGERVCGLYNINPSKFGLVDNFITSASAFGEQTNIFNGVDLGLQARLPRGVVVSGGLAIGNSVAFGSNDGTSSAKRCFVVDSPEELRYCDTPVPYMAQIKLFGTYPLPGNVQLSANFQSIPGSNYSATYNATTAEVAPSLGRQLAGGARTVAIPLTQPWTLWEERINQIDIRALKGFRVKRARIEGTVDVFNVFNAASVLNQVMVLGPAFRRPTQILEGRMVKFGAKLEF